VLREAAWSGEARHGGDRLQEACNFLRVVLSDGPKPTIGIEGRL
jgi:hypothetical protein